MNAGMAGGAKRSHKGPGLWEMEGTQNPWHRGERGMEGMHIFWPGGKEKGGTQSTWYGEKGGGNHHESLK